MGLLIPALLFSHKVSECCRAKDLASLDTFALEFKAMLFREAPTRALEVSTGLMTSALRSGINSVSSVCRSKASAGVVTEREAPKKQESQVTVLAPSWPGE